MWLVTTVLDTVFLEKKLQNFKRWDGMYNTQRETNMGIEWSVQAQDSFI